MAQPVICAAKRTPIGRFLGGLSRVPSPQLGAYIIEAVLDEVPGAADHVDECIMGCVLQAGLGQNPARQAGLKAGLPDTLNAMTVNKVCGSGLQAVMLAAQSIKAGDNRLVVAGGFENIAAAAVGELAYWRLTGGEEAGEIKPVKADAMVLARDAEAGLRALVARFDDPATPYLARPDAARAPRFSDYEHLARVKEWSDPARGEET